MEGLIPFVYRAIVQYKTGGQIAGSWFCESPSASNYMRLPGDSGRFQASGIQMFQPDRVLFSSTTSSSSPSTCMAATAPASSTSSAQSPLCRSNSRRLTAIS